MGDPRRLRNKFTKPKRLWDEDRIKRDIELRKEYGLKNSSEIWKADEELRKYRREARRLLSLREEERKADAKKILTKLTNLGIMKEGDIDDILSLSVRDILERRLQTIVYRKGMAKSAKQARQLITHGFIAVNGRKVSIPSYLISAKEEKMITYNKPIDLTAGEFKEKTAAIENEEQQKPAAAQQ